MSTPETAREPCPDRILDDLGGAFAMRAIGGSAYQFIKGIYNSPNGHRLSGGAQAARMSAPRLGGSFAVWGWPLLRLRLHLHPPPPEGEPLELHHRRRHHWRLPRHAPGPPQCGEFRRLRRHSPRHDRGTIVVAVKDLNTMWVVYMIPTGLSSAVSIRVSNELGAGHPLKARISVFAVVIIAMAEGLIVAVTTILVCHVWGYVYNNEEEVVKYVSTMMPLLAASDFMDGIQCALSGAARGCGLQKICSYINLGAYYAVGIPCAILLAFVMNVGGKGLWIGIICALTVQVLVLVSVILNTDWDKEFSKVDPANKTVSTNNCWCSTSRTGTFFILSTHMIINPLVASTTLYFPKALYGLMNMC